MPMHKILSYLLICTGLFIVFLALHAMYQVFVAHGVAPTLVNFTDLTLQTQAGPLKLPMQQVNIVANVGLFALFMGFLVAVGGKIAQIGCQILKIERLREALLQLKTQEIKLETFKKL